MELAVGDSARLEMIFSTGLYNRIVPKSAAIYTDINAEITIVRISARVTAPLGDPPFYVTYPVQIDPWNLCFHPTDHESIEDIEFEITNVSNDPIALKRASWPDTLVDFTLPWAIPSGESAIATVHADAAAYMPSFYKSLTFELSDDARTRFTIPVTGEVPSIPYIEPCEYTAGRD